ncbi:hypothetical protein [Streptomyces sp. MN13]
MDEPTDPPPAPERRRTAVAGSRLAPLQEAWAAYVEHARHCARCRDVDSGACSTAERLWRAWREASGQAMRQIRQG